MRNLASITSLLILFTLLVFAHTSVSYTTYAQAGTSPVNNSSQQAEVKITSLKQNQTVPSGELVIQGVSSDTPATNCQVSVDWNDAKPMQNVTPAGTGGKDDFSKWTFTYAKNYHLITEGINELTSKISCPSTNTEEGNIAKKFYSVNITGTNASVPTSNNQRSKISIPLNTLGSSASDSSSIVDLSSSNRNSSAGVSYSSYKNSSADLSASKVHGVAYKGLLPQYSQSAYSDKSQASDHVTTLPALTNTTGEAENNSTLPALTNTTGEAENNSTLPALTNTTGAAGCNSTLPALTNVTAPGDYNSTILGFANDTNNACLLPGINITQAVTTAEETGDSNDGENNGDDDNSGGSTHDSGSGSHSSSSNNDHENHDDDNNDNSGDNHDSHSGHHDDKKGHEHHDGGGKDDGGDNNEGEGENNGNGGNGGGDGNGGNGGDGNGGNPGNNDGSGGNS
jgi:hypothetical protein